ncbi:phage virion morphogenesis protein [Solidesulfovibrio sp.]|uniref:phage virion morphogenesis protein n=1 Tax=Solidesulfovibrio sp. TaxID=2910990 RepID=UPI002B21787C|nr:phage virion morphogenesis protein [Solidesulfovibrio sp.]MEA5090815.1 phage virion morphogenesis protein [Solidesulfovibrio sp.]
MAGVTIRIEDNALRTALASLSARLGNMQDVMDAIGSRLVGRARDDYAREQAPDGTPWQPLAASTRRSRQRTGHWPGPILRVSGKLFRSLNYKPSPMSVELGAGWNESAAYAAIHQFGGRVLRPMRRGVLRFKIDKDGRSRFAKKSKANFEQDVTFGGDPITIPARPYLPMSPLPDAYLQSCLDAINQGLLGGGANG